MAIDPDLDPIITDIQTRLDMLETTQKSNTSDKDALDLALINFFAKFYKKLSVSTTIDATIFVNNLESQIV